MLTLKKSLLEKIDFWLDTNGDIPKLVTGLGVELDRDRMREYAELFRRTGGYAYDRDPERPQWFAVVPETRFARPTLDRKRRRTRNPESR